MKKRVVILPMSGYPNGKKLLKELTKILNSPVSDLLAFIELNDAVHLSDMGGPEVFNSIHFNLANHGIHAGILLDLKIFDVSPIMENVLKKYLLFPPDILTISSSCSVDGIIKLRKLLPKTKLAMVSVLTDISQEECFERFDMLPHEKIESDLSRITKVYRRKTADSNMNPRPFDMLVCSPRELSHLTRKFPEYEFIVLGTRDWWMKKENEHQKKTTGIKEALINGATYVVMDDQLTKGNPEMDISPEESCRLTMREIKSMVAAY